MWEANVAFIGTGGVGKSSIIARLMNRDLVTKYRPTIEENHDFEFEVAPNKTVSFHFYDTSGQDEYYAISDMATVHAHIVVVVCEIGEAATLKAAEERIIRTQRQREDPSLPVLLVCNKIDKPQSGEQNEKAVNDLAARKNVELFWTSAKNKIGIPQLLQRLVELAPEAQTNRKCCNLI